MKYFLVAFSAIFLLISPAYGQEVKNPSLTLHTEEIPWHQFNVVARDSTIVELSQIHATSWQVTIVNDLLFESEIGNSVIRLYDVNNSENFIEVGMGNPPDKKFWAAVQLPQEGYVVIHSKLERGWNPDRKIIISYTEKAGMTINNGERIVVTNLDIGQFAIGSYSVHGLEGSTDPPSVYSGFLNVEFLSGDPTQNIFHLMPFFVTASVGGLAAILFLTKKRSSSQ